MRTITHRSTDADFQVDIVNSEGPRQLLFQKVVETYRIRILFIGEDKRYPVEEQSKGEEAGHLRDDGSTV